MTIRIMPVALAIALVCTLPLEAFARGARGAGPRLYLFTVQQEPQPFLRACVAASGGSATSVSWLRKGDGRPP